MKQPHSVNIRRISYYIGYIIAVVGLTMAMPIVLAALYGEWNVVVDFILSMAVSVIVGLAMIRFGKAANSGDGSLQWKDGFIIASLSWFFLMILASIPYLLSGHSASLLDACFDVMSGFTTTGLFIMTDLDHISVGLNAWRHLITFIGGQGMIVLAISLLVPDVAGAFKFYVGEGKDVALVPNIRGTARIIWLISVVYVVIGTIALWIAGIASGFDVDSAFLHALFISESAWSTGGFAPNLQNLLYYHNIAYEIITIVIMILGSFNFALHYAIIKGRRGEFVKNIEVQSFMAACFVFASLAVVWLVKSGIYSDAVALFRRGVYIVLSAQTTTGFGTIYAQQFMLEWGAFGILVLVMAMLIGGSSASTAGGFKGLRVGIVVRGIIADIRRLFHGENYIKHVKYHHIRDHVLDDAVFRSASGIILLYILTFTIGTIIGVLCGYPLGAAAFEAASVTGNVGLSIGVTAPGMPALLKIWYIVAMYLGRLEFMSVFVLIGVFFQGVARCIKNLFSRRSSR